MNRPEPTPVADALADFIGHQVPGGCEDCGAFQTLEREAVGVYVVRVFHDQSCPWWRGSLAGGDRA